MHSKTIPELPWAPYDSVFRTNYTAHRLRNLSGVLALSLGLSNEIESKFRERRKWRRFAAADWWSEKESAGATKRPAPKPTNTCDCARKSSGKLQFAPSCRPKVCRPTELRKHCNCAPNLWTSTEKLSLGIVRANNRIYIFISKFSSFDSMNFRMVNYLQMYMRLSQMVNSGSLEIVHYRGKNENLSGPNFMLSFGCTDPDKMAKFFAISRNYRVVLLGVLARNQLNRSQFWQLLSVKSRVTVYLFWRHLSFLLLFVSHIICGSFHFPNTEISNWIWPKLDLVPLCQCTSVIRQQIFKWITSETRG